MRVMTFGQNYNKDLKSQGCSSDPFDECLRKHNRFLLLCFLIVSQCDRYICVLCLSLFV